MEKVSKEGEIRLVIRCPKCGRENYSANVYSGQCTWCPYNAHFDINYNKQ